MITLNNIKITIFKELRTMLRAKKTLFTMFLLPCFIPVMVFLYCYLMENPSVNEYKIGIDYKLSTAEENIIKKTQLSMSQTMNHI